MSGCLYDCTPIDYGCTSLTVSSAAITVSCTCCSYIRKSYKLCIVVVPIINLVINLCSNGDSTTESCIFTVCIFNLTHNNIALNLNNRTFTGCILSLRSNRFTRYVINTIPRPKSYRNAYKSFIFRNCKYTCNFFHSKCQYVLRNVYRISCLKSVCNYYTLRLPSICTLKFQFSSNLINVCKICYVNIYIVNRIILRHQS